MAPHYDLFQLPNADDSDEALEDSRIRPGRVHGDECRLSPLKDGVLSPQSDLAPGTRTSRIRVRSPGGVDTSGHQTAFDRCKGREGQWPVVPGALS